MLFTVLTGDIVASTALDASELDATLDAVRGASVLVSQWGAPDPVTGFARRGGDGWQIAFTDFARSLRAALLVQAYIRRLGKGRATRIAIATGEGTLPASGDPNAAHGTAFVTSGRLLETMPPERLMDHADGGARAATVLLADRIAQGWTPAQARAMAEILPPGSGPHSAVASLLGITRQAVDQALTAAGWPAMDAALTAWETEWHSA
ncbi:MarR family transcriptional regulator [Primorskyibacter sp. 2E107]|uniref:MarR family transcriptional regulator n=1 Tax=Primorskyibacter sp. 2E107 TaxID=3403458 RepID=UPI003AF5B5F4